MRERVSAAEWDVRVNLAACYRLVAKYGMTDLIYNHITARVPGPEHHILISGYGMLYEEVTASSLIKVDLAGNVIEKPDHGYSVNAAGYISAEPRVFGFEKPIGETCQERLCAHKMPVSGICGCRVNLDQHLIVLGRRFFYVLELKNIR